jgi:serine/threonine-protein kinase HipA
MLAPVYDLVNTSLALKLPKDEIALSLRGKKNKLNKDDFLIYLAKERLGLSDKIIQIVLQKFLKAKPFWIDWIDRSFLSEDERNDYKILLEERWQKIFMNEGHIF